MDIIKEFGGYASAKIVQGCREVGGLPTDYELDEALLEYRREHGIYEVGDKVVIVNHHYASQSIHVVDNPVNENSVGIAPLCKSGNVLKICAQLANPYYLRHATDEEIKANKKLD